jgi:hypothetical protein
MMFELHAVIDSADYLGQLKPVEYMKIEALPVIPELGSYLWNYLTMPEGTKLGDRNHSAYCLKVVQIIFRKGDLPMIVVKLPTQASMFSSFQQCVTGVTHTVDEETVAKMFQFWKKVESVDPAAKTKDETCEGK